MSFRFRGMFTQGCQSALHPFRPVERCGGDARTSPAANDDFSVVKKALRLS